MLAELVEKLVSLGSESQTIVYEKPPAEPPHVYFTREQNGDLLRRSAEPAPRQHTALDLQPIIDMAKTWSEYCKIVSIWASRQGVVCLLDDATRRDRVSMLLSWSEQLAVLKGFAQPTPTWMKQEDLVRVLRISLAGCVPTSLLPIVRKTKFRQNAEGETEVAHGKASMGRSMERELTGTSNIPEQITVIVPLWQGFQAHHPYPVECAIEIDVVTERFAIVPLPGEIERAIRKGESDLINHLKAQFVDEGSTVMVYYGTP